MSKIFLIPGLGADSQIYKNIDVFGHEPVYVNWIEPDESDTLSSYSQKLIDKYLIAENSIVIGNSLGGMIAIEIAKKVKLDKVILISSIKTIDEAPWYFKFVKTTNLHRLVPVHKLTSMEFLIEYAFGSMSNDDKELFKDMLRNTPLKFIKWATNAIVNWDNHFVPPNVYHITGDKDHVFSHRIIKGATIIKDGTHIMIFDKAAQINNWLKHIL